MKKMKYLDGISVYDGGDYWHFITYGLSELYEKESEDKEWSGYGMEFTLKLKKDHYENEEDEIRCICGILQSIARITFTHGELFNAYEYLYTGQTTGIDSNGTSNITGFITVPDDKFVEIDTPNGKVSFVEFIGVTVYTGQTTGIDSNGTSNITGFITVPDDKFVEIDTPNGKVSFVEFIGVTDKELVAIQHKELTIKELFEKLNTDVTSYTRPSIV